MYLQMCLSGSSAFRLLTPGGGRVVLSPDILSSDEVLNLDENTTNLRNTALQRVEGNSLYTEY